MNAQCVGESEAEDDRQELLQEVLATLRKLLERPGPADKILLTQKEAADRLSLSRARVSELTGRGEIPVVYSGRKPLYPVAALERWVEQQLSGAGGTKSCRGSVGVTTRAAGGKGRTGDGTRI